MSEQHYWYFAETKKDEISGPHTTQEIQSMLERQVLRPDDYVWASHLGSSRWQRICDVKFFHSYLVPYPTLKVPKLTGSKGSKSSTLEFSGAGEFGTENMYRRYPRAPLDVEVILHDKIHLQRGRTIDISEKGVFFELSSLQSEFKKGDQVTVTFRKAPGELGTFSVKGVIVRFSETDTGGRYGVFFLRINPKIKRNIAQYIIKVLKDSKVHPEAA